MEGSQREGEKKSPLSVSSLIHTTSSIQQEAGRLSTALLRLESCGEKMEFASNMKHGVCSYINYPEATKNERPKNENTLPHITRYLTQILRSFGSAFTREIGLFTCLSVEL